MPARDRADPDLSARLIIGGIAGFVATMALAATMRRLGDRRAGAGPGAPARPGVPAVDLAVTFAYGAACGAALAAAGPRIGRIAGSAAGAGLWLVGEMGWLPPLGGGSAAPVALRHRITSFGAHLAWGWSTAEAIRELATINATPARVPRRA